MMPPNVEERKNQEVTWHATSFIKLLGDREETGKDPFLYILAFASHDLRRDGTPKLLGKIRANPYRSNSLLLPTKQPNYRKTTNAHPFLHGPGELRDEERVSGVWKNRDEQTVQQ